MTATYYAEADALAKSFADAVGWALQYRIKVYTVLNGTVYMTALGTLRDEVAAHRRSTEEPAGQRRSFNDGRIPACGTNGHPARIGVAPVMLKPGERMRMYASAANCPCGAPIYGGQ